MKFQTTVELGGKTATGIRVPAEVVEELGAGKRPAVLVTIRDHTYRSTIATLDGEFMLPVSAAVREQAGIAAGDEVEVEVELDTAPREVVVPPDLAAALETDAAAKQFFESLSYSNKRRIVEPIGDAKTAETRQRRIDKAVGKLHEGKI
ncbi:MAG: YdeI/OmpD-associated family protein [Chloroflexota bacterium]|jgi:bifunctional DNA-binding transcriptional regulator/antitoxin component of YhaV-PrlF toxin-antitoxin module